MTSLAGLPTYMDLASATGLLRSLDRHLNIRAGNQGWTDRQMVFSLMMLNLAGGDCVEDVEKLEADEGLCRVIRMAEASGLTRKEKQCLASRWRKERTRTLPSASAIFRYLSFFHDKEQEKQRVEGKAFIPSANEHLKSLARINSELIGFQRGNRAEEPATIDMDATLSETLKKNALYGYQGEQAYQPLNAYWWERGVILHTEFRDGNVPAGYEQLRVLKESLHYQ